MVYSRISSQSLCRTLRTWTFPGLADAGLTCLPSFSLLKQSSWRVSFYLSCLSLSQSQGRNLFHGATWPRPCVQSCWLMPPPPHSDVSCSRCSLPSDSAGRLCVLHSSDHRSGSVDHQRSQINITAFTNTEQPISISGTVLFGGDAYRCRHLPTLVILPGITHRGDHRRRGHRTDTTQLLQAHTVFVVLSQSLDQLIHLANTIIEQSEDPSHTPCSKAAKVTG